jgi:hypothetical protein
MKLFSKKGNRVKFASVILLVSTMTTLTGCGGLTSLVDGGNEQEQEALESIRAQCENSEKSALSYQNQNPKERTVTALSEASRSLETCRNSIESALQPYLSGETNTLVTTISNPDEAKIELGGKSKTLKQVFQHTLNLEKKLATLPIDVCMERNGELSAKGYGSTWEPYVLRLTDWRGANCIYSDSDFYLTSSISSSDKSRIQNACSGAVIRAADVKIEVIGLNLAKRWSSVRCQKPKETKTGIAFLSKPKVDERCVACVKWAKAVK